jgi:outer membrane assembly lipoprotein YfiO
LARKPITLYRVHFGEADEQDNPWAYCATMKEARAQRRRALYKLGLCYWLETPRSQRDQQKSFDALSRFLQYQQTYPDGVHATDVSKLLREIHEQLAKKDFDAARWYFRQKNGRAAMVYCDKIIENHPDNLYWARALLMKGEILLRRGQNEEAIQQFTRVVDYPGHPEIRREAQEKIREARR